MWCWYSPPSDGSRTPGAAVLGIGLTAWPFVVALAASTIALLAVHRPAYTLLNGVFVWLGTLIVGMLLRAGTGGMASIEFRGRRGNLPRTHHAGLAIAGPRAKHPDGLKRFR